MGREQRQREAAGNVGPRWKPAREAPKNAWPLALCATLLCDCAGHQKGGRIVLTGSRYDGEWLCDCAHHIDITHYMELPQPPPH